MPPIVPEHEKTYGTFYVGGFIHRSRLRRVITTIHRYARGPDTSWADFGCSNGFIIDTVLKGGAAHFSRIVGYDHSRELLAIATARGINGVSFQYCDMNVSPSDDSPAGRFGLVTCFETLEHVANYKIAFRHLFEALGSGGVLIVTVPNEVGLWGLLKFWGRYAARRRPYGDFFARGGRWSYVRALLAGATTEGFRPPAANGYGPHLGFDYRRLAAHIRDSYVLAGRLEFAEHVRTAMGMNILLVYRRP